jgi:hypothetical protein
MASSGADELTSLKPSGGKRTREANIDRCGWGCGIEIEGSPYRSPIEGWLGRYVVCSPTCPNRPEGVHVISVKPWR